MAKRNKKEGKKVKVKAKAKKATVAMFTAQVMGIKVLEGQIKNANKDGVSIVVKRPRSSKHELLMIPAENVVAYAKGAGKKGQDVVIVQGVQEILAGKASAFKLVDGLVKVNVEGIEWTINPSKALTEYKEVL